MRDEQGFLRDASQRLTFEVNSLPAAEYEAVCRRMARALRLKPASRLVDGLDVLFRDYQRDGQLIELAWDNWSGLIVTAKAPEAEPLVREAAAWLRTGRSLEPDPPWWRRILGRIIPATVRSPTS